VIEAIKEIGEYALKQNQQNPENPIEVIIEDPASSPTYKHVLAILLNETGDAFEYGGIQHEEYSKYKKEKYLYRQGSSRGTDLSPTSRLTELDKTFNNKIIAWFKNAVNNKNLRINEKERHMLKKIYKCTFLNKDTITLDLNEKIKSFKNVGTNENGIITFILKLKNGHLNYIGDIDIFKQIMVQYFSENLYHSATYNLDSISYNQTCSVCKKKSEEVYGLVSTYTFYNVDKPGFVSGGFERSESWKNYPVCVRCALSLEAGKQYIDDFFKYNSYGFNYYIIPKFFQQDGSSEIYESLTNYRKNIQEGNLTIKKEYGNLLSETEDDAFEMLSKKDNIISNNLLFYKKENDAFRILLYVEDILPSRLRRLFEAKLIVDKKDIFNDLSGKGYPLLFTFGNIWHFFNNEGDKKKYFLEAANNIFVGKKLEYNFLMKNIIYKIRKDFVPKNKYETSFSTLKGFQLLNYLNILCLLNNFDGGINMNKELNQLLDEQDNYIDQKASLLFAEFPGFFNQSAKKAIFLQGVLTQFLLDIQMVVRGAAPFRAKLQNLNIDEKLVKKLFPQIQAKLEEYNKNYYKHLEVSISQHMLQAGDNWRMSKDEISFYYVLGMNLSYLFKKEGDKANE